MLELLQTVDAYALNSRQPGTNQTFYRSVTLLLQDSAMHVWEDATYVSYPARFPELAANH